MSAFTSEQVNRACLFAKEEEQSVFRLIKGICAERRTRKRLVVNQRRYEGACNRIADVNVTFCDRGAAADMAPHKTQATAVFAPRVPKSQKGGSDSEPL